ncbi:ABC transporter permease [bacterium]|nr:ABC transporter permease [bacterium]
MKSSSKIQTLKASVEHFLPFISVLVLMVALSLSTPHFLTWLNISNIIRQHAQIIIMAVGMTFVIVSAGIDLSVGSMMALAGICGTFLMTAGVPIPLAVLGGCFAGLVCGLLNGLLISRLKIPPFIATLGTMQVFRGLVLEITKGLPVDEGIPRSFGILRNGNLSDLIPIPFFDLIPIPLVLILLICVLASLTLRYTRLGRYSYAIGSNVEAAHHSGIRVGTYIVLIYAVCGFLAGLAGMIEFSSLVSGQPTAGVGYELKVIAAVVIGGGSLMGGEGSVSGTIAGALLMAILLNACVHLHISDYIQQIVIGALIVLAVAFDQLRKRKMAGGGV